jgi:hypothetical protein
LWIELRKLLNELSLHCLGAFSRVIVWPLLLSLRCKLIMMQLKSTYNGWLIVMWRITSIWILVEEQLSLWNLFNADQTSPRWLVWHRCDVLRKLFTFL